MNQSIQPTRKHRPRGSERDLATQPLLDIPDLPLFSATGFRLSSATATNLSCYFPVFQEMIRLKLVWPACLVQRDHLAVDHGLFRERRERLHDDGISGGEILVAPRPEMDLAVRLDSQRPVAIQLLHPIRAFG